MKTRTLILSISLASFAILGGPVVAEDTQTLRQALKAEARDTLRVAGKDMLSQSLASFHEENLLSAKAAKRPELPACESLILVAEAAAEASSVQDASREPAPVMEQSVLGGLVVYSGNR